MLEFLPLAHVLKLSDEELYFLTGEDSIEAAKEKTFCRKCLSPYLYQGSRWSRVLYEESKGTKQGRESKGGGYHRSRGDAFIGSFLYQLYKDGVTEADLPELTSDKMAVYLDFSNRYCAKSVQKAGAIASYPTMAEMEE